jgi:ABC-type sugar transport system substrate-binding protein
MPDSTNGAPRGINRAGFLRRAALLGVTSAGTGTLLAACGDGDKNAGAASTTATAATTTGGPVTTALAAKYKNKTIGVPVYTFLDDNELAIVEGLKQAAKSADLNWKFIVIDTKADQATAQTAVQSLVNRKVDCIIDITVPAAFITAQLAAAKAAKIPVVGNFTNAPFEPNLVADYSQALDHDAVLMSHYLINDQMQTRGRKDLKVGMLDSPLDVTKVRRTIFEAIAKDTKGVEVVAQDFTISLTDTVSDATKKAKAMLQKNSGITALWCNYPPITLPVASGVAQAGKSDVQVYGHNAQSAGVAAIRDGGTPLVATTWADNNYQGYALIDIALQVFAGKTPNRQVTWQQPIPEVLFDKTNVGAQVPKDLKASNWKYLGGLYAQDFLKNWNEAYAS